MLINLCGLQLAAAYAHPLVPRKVFKCFNLAITTINQDLPDSFTLVKTMLEQEPPIPGQAVDTVPGNLPNSIKPILSGD